MQSNADKKEGHTCDTVAGITGRNQTQPIENVTSGKNKTCDMSQVSSSSIRKTMELQERLLIAQERLLSLTEQNAELRLQLEHRDQRLRELERENEELRKLRKRASRFCPQSGQDVG